MDASTTLAELETLASKLEVDVTYDRFSGEGASSGGLCKVKGRWRAIIERRSSSAEKVSVLARCLARFDLEDHFISPAVRELIERERDRVSV